MRVLTGIVILMLVAIQAYAQAGQKSKCKVQDLAIAAAIGDSEAQFRLGTVFFAGRDVPQDYVRAATMWHLSSNTGHIASFNNLGYLTYYGLGVQQDYAEGLRLWRIAAEKGFAESQFHIGFAYSDGEHLKKDHVEAYAWLIAGKHYAADAHEDKILQMVEKRLTQVRGWLAPGQLAEAEKRGAEYIVKYGIK